MTLLSWIGRHASALLLLGFLTVPFLPVSTEALRPLLPPCVILVTALGVSRQRQDRASLLHLFDPSHLVASLSWLVVTQVIATVVVIALGRALGATPELLMLLATFLVAPPMSSAPNICLILGYEHTMALRLTLLGILSAPILMPLALSLSGFAFDSSSLAVGLRVLTLLAIGVALGALIQFRMGQDRVARHADAFSGAAALAMLIFLLPLLSGTKDAILAAPRLGLSLLALATALNLLGNLSVRLLSTWKLGRAGAATLGFIFGNRNLSLVLASVPYDPVLTLFVALMQASIYATPALVTFAHKHRKSFPAPPKI